MIELIEFNTFSTEWGIGAVVYKKTENKTGLVGLLIPYENEKNLEKELHNRYGQTMLNERLGVETCLNLQLYFSGERISFDEQPDLSCRSQFEISVYNNLKAIPYGEITTYKKLAKQCGSPDAARAVGNAMRKNPTPIIIPCHRVLKSDGSIGGWSGKPGWKERLLAIEGRKLIVDNIELV